MARFGSVRPRLRLRPVAAVLAIGVAVAVVASSTSSCSGNSSVPVHGEVFKTVGRPCALLSQAFPGVGRRIVTFLDPVGSTGCRLSAAYAVDLPIRQSYAANVSSQVTDLPTSPPIDYDALAAHDWRFDIRIPPTG
jgi:hypothetical protein